MWFHVKSEWEKNSKISRLCLQCYVYQHFCTQVYFLFQWWSRKYEKIMIVGFILEMSFLENLSSCFRGFTDKGRPSIELIPNSTNDPPTYRASFSEAGSLGGQTRHQVLLSTLSTPSTSQRTMKEQFPDEIRHLDVTVWKLRIFLPYRLYVKSFLTKNVHTFTI